MFGVSGIGQITPGMENQMDKNMLTGKLGLCRGLKGYMRDRERATVHISRAKGP